MGEGEKTCSRRCELFTLGEHKEGLCRTSLITQSLSTLIKLVYQTKMSRNLVVSSNVMSCHNNIRSQPHAGV